MFERDHHFHVLNFMADDSFEAAENPRDFDKILDSPTFNEVWADMEKVLASGKVRAIGDYVLLQARLSDSDSIVLAFRCQQLFHKDVRLTDTSINSTKPCIQSGPASGYSCRHAGGEPS
jgi:hypothetical protein